MKKLRKQVGSGRKLVIHQERIAQLSQLELSVAKGGHEVVSPRGEIFQTVPRCSEV